jgi:hypothetical protein
MVSRAFDTAAGADSITFAVGNAPPDQGPITVAVWAKSFSVIGFTMWMIRGLKSGTAIWGFLTSNNAGPKLFSENDFGSGVPGLSTSWRWYILTKAAGAALPRIHVGDGLGSWTHTDDNFNVSDGSGPIDTLIVGGAGGGANGWRGSIGMVATWTSVLSDATIEATFGKSAAPVYALSPGWMARLNQASTTTPVPDDTGGGGDQTAISGTTIDSDDGGFDYSLVSTTPFTKDVDLRWRVLNSIVKDTDLRWRVLNTIQQDVDLQWRVLNSVTKDISVQWRVLNSFVKDHDLQWRILNTFAVDSDLQWRVLGALIKDYVLQWQVRGSFNKDVVIEWRVLGTFATDYVLQWRIRDVATSAQWSLWDGSTEVPLTLEGIWDGARLVPVDSDIVA